MSTLTELARYCEVAPSTASRVLNGYKDFSVRPEVRQRILEAAKHLDYRPTLAARNLRAKRTKLVGVLGLNGLPHPGGLEIHVMREVVDQLHKAGLDTIVSLPRRGVAAAAELPPWRLDGAVLVHLHEASACEALERHGTPYVVVNGRCGPGGWEVQVDDREGMRQAVDHLLGLGHRRIAFVDRHFRPGHPSRQTREAAYAEAMREHGLPLIQDVLEKDGPARPVLERVVRESGATAVIGFDHFTVIELVDVSWEMGLSIPGDFSVICFNDEYPVERIRPHLTAVRLPAETIAQRTGELLLERLEAGEGAEPKRVCVPEELVVRDSTGPARR